MLRKRKEIWKLYNLRKGPGAYLLAEMEEKDFDKFVSGIILEINGLRISFIETPVVPIVIYRGIRKDREKLPFEK